MVLWWWSPGLSRARSVVVTFLSPPLLLRNLAGGDVGDGDKSPGDLIAGQGRIGAEELREVAAKPESGEPVAAFEPRHPELAGVS